MMVQLHLGIAERLVSNQGHLYHLVFRGVQNTHAISIDHALQLLQVLQLAPFLFKYTDHGWQLDSFSSSSAYNQVSPSYQETLAFPRQQVSLQYHPHLGFVDIPCHRFSQ